MDALILKRKEPDRRIRLFFVRRVCHIRLDASQQDQDQHDNENRTDEA